MKTEVKGYMDYSSFDLIYKAKKKLDPKKDRYSQEEDNSKRTHLLDVCQDLQMSMSGASDPLPHHVEEKYVAWLMMRLENWKYTGRAYDEAIRQVVSITVKDCLDYCRNCPYDRST